MRKRKGRAVASPRRKGKRRKKTSLIPSLTLHLENGLDQKPRRKEARNTDRDQSPAYEQKVGHGPSLVPGPKKKKDQNQKYGRDRVWAATTKYALM